MLMHKYLQFLPQVAQGGQGMIEQHAGTGVAHHGLHPEA